MYSMAPRKYGLNQGATVTASEFNPSLRRRRRPVEWLGRGTLTSMENPSSQNTGTFSDFAIPGANTFCFELTRKCTNFLCAAQIGSKTALMHVQLREDGEDGGCASSATTLHIHEHIRSVIDLPVTSGG
jgi:hypothetical protein